MFPNNLSCLSADWLQTSVSVKYTQQAAGQATERSQRPAINLNINKETHARSSVLRETCGGRVPQTGGPPAAGAGVLGELLRPAASPCPRGSPAGHRRDSPVPGMHRVHPLTSWELAGRAGRGRSLPGQGSWGILGRVTPSFQAFPPGSPMRGCDGSSPRRPSNWLIWGT